jgi:hypothetical protein
VKNGERQTQAQIKIRNILDQPLKGVIRVDNTAGWKPCLANFPFDILPGKSAEFVVKFVAEQQVPPRVNVPFSIILNKGEMNTKGELRFISCTPLKKVMGMAKVGGVEQCKESMLLAKLDKKECFHNLRVGDVDGNLFWKGSQDLSGKLYGAWDDNNLYLWFRAVDDVHYQRRNDSGIWAADSLQIAIANMSDRNAQVGIALTNDGDKVFNQWKGKFAAVPKYEVARQGGECRYQIAIPWKDLGVTPSKQTMFAMSILLNDNDGRGRKVILEWGGGIHGMGGTALYRPVILSE